MRYKDRTGKEVCANGQQDALLQKLYGSFIRYDNFADKQKRRKK